MALPLLHNTAVIEQPVNLNTLEERYVQKAEEFIKKSEAAGKPWLVYLAWSHVHVPDFVAPQFCNRSARGRFGDAMEEMDNHIGQTQLSTGCCDLFMCHGTRIMIDVALYDLDHQNTVHGLHPPDLRLPHRDVNQIAIRSNNNLAASFV